jgi:hypothetical protein
MNKQLFLNIKEKIKKNYIISDIEFYNIFINVIDKLLNKKYIHKLDDKLKILIEKHWNNDNPMLKHEELKISADEIISKWNYKLSEDFINLITNSDAFPRLKLKNKNDPRLKFKNKNDVIQKFVDESETTIMFFDDGIWVISHIFESNYPEYKGKLLKSHNPFSTK